MRTRSGIVAVCFLSILFLLCDVALAEETSINPQSSGPSIGEFMSPEGRFDLETARQSGFEGSLDLECFDVQLDPVTGEPAVRAASEGTAKDDPDDIYWDNSISPSVPGVDGIVYAAVVYDNKLIVGGSFYIAGGTVANNIAAWDGSSWSPLGSGTGGCVYALSIYDGKLIAGGDFAVASWDGSEWSLLDAGPYFVYALAVHDNKLIAGGQFTTAGGVLASRIASWDGSSWSPLGSGMNNDVRALTVYDGSLIAGGYFTTAGSNSASKIASWNGYAWSALGSGIESDYNGVHALAVWQDCLVAGGSYYGPSGTYGLVSWDGSIWTQLYPDGIDDVMALAVHGDNLIVGGCFSATDTTGAAMFNIGSWDGTSWNHVSGGTNGSVRAISVYEGSIVAAGDFYEAIPSYALHVALLSDSGWSSLGIGMYGGVFAFTVSESKLFVGGSFRTAGDMTLTGVAAWDGSSWSSVGSGLNGGVTAFAEYDGEMVAGGVGFDAGGVGYSVASWNGSEWSVLGDIDGEVYALAAFDGKLIVGGAFDTAGGVAARRIASWDGSSWSSLGSGMSGTVVNALTLYNGKLIAGGWFTSAGGTSANNVASWDGSTWSALGSGMNDPVSALTTYDGQLIAGGAFTSAGGTGVNQIAGWDGSTWSSLGSGLGCNVFALTVYNGNLIAGGCFWGIGGNYIASWDGTSWSSLGSGTNYLVLALTAYNGSLMAGGHFSIAGNKVSALLAEWTKGQSCEGFDGLFCDDFEGAYSEKWHDLAGSHPCGSEWEVLDNALHVRAIGTDQLCRIGLIEPTWQDYTLDVDVRSNEGVCKEVAVRSQDGLNTYDVNLVGEPVNALGLNKVENGVSSALSVVPYSSQTGVWYHLTITCSGATISVSVNGEEQLTYTDTNHPYFAGGVGLVAWTGSEGVCDVSFDNVTVTALDAGIDFEIAEDGWSFSNTNPDVWVNWHLGDPLNELDLRCNKTRVFPSWDLFTDAFGADQTEYPDGRKREAAFKFWKENKRCHNGSCAGFAVSSLMVYDGILAVQGAEDLFHVPIDQGRPYVNKYFLHQFGRAEIEKVAEVDGDTPRETLEKCRWMLHTEQGSRCTLAMRGSDGAHRVFPYTTTIDTENPHIHYIYVYDPNHPYDANNPTDCVRRVAVDLSTADGTWSYDDYPAWGGSLGLTLRLPASAHENAPELLLPSSSWVSRGRADRCLVLVNEVAEVRLTSATEQSIGVDSGLYFNTTTEGVGLYAETGAGSTPFGYYLPSGLWDVSMSQPVDSEARVSVFTEQNILSCVMQTDDDTDSLDVSFDAGNGIVTCVNAADSARSFEIEVIEVTGDSEVVYQASGIIVQDGDSVRVIEESPTTFTLQNYGPATTYDLVLKSTSASSHWEFYHSALQCPQLTSHTVSAVLGIGDSLIVLVDSAMTGAVTDTLVLANQGPPSCCLDIRGNLDGSPDDTPTLGDLTIMIDHLFISLFPLDCWEEGNLDESQPEGPGSVTLGDLTIMIDVLFVSLNPPPPCP